MTKAVKLIALDDYIKDAGSVAEAARRLGVEYILLWRWARRKEFAGRLWTKELAAKGIEAPARPPKVAA